MNPWSKEYAQLLGWTIVILLIALLSGCATPPPWETCELKCWAYANEACLAAMMDNKPSGVVHCKMPRTVDRHAVTWIYKDGKQVFYDRAFGCYRTLSELGTIYRVTEGPSRGAYETFPYPPMPDVEKLILKPTRKETEW